MNRTPRPIGRAAAHAPKRRQILVFTEGETEVDYLTAYWRDNANKVTVTIDAFHGSPKSLVDRAATAKRSDARSAKRGGGRPFDEIWCVFDCDEHPFVPEALQKAADNGIGVAYSVPCIELWFVLHFEDQQAHIERGPAQARSKTLLGSQKRLGRDEARELAGRFEDAKARAQALELKHDGDGSPVHTNPSSTIWRLVDRIVDG